MGTREFYEESATNAFDRMRVDVAAVYERYPPEEKAPDASLEPAKGAFDHLYGAHALPLSQRVRVAKLLRRTGVEAAWFTTFATYWQSVLDGRPLWGIEDFHFLRGWYRVGHQENRIPDTDDPRVHLEAWQRPELIYQLFQQVYYETRHPNIALLELFRRARRERGIRSLLEFGCASAPATTWIDTFLGLHGAEVFLADLQTLPLHYAGFKFRAHRNVHPLVLVPENGFALDLGTKVDAIACLTVFEHLNEPLATAESFYEHLSPGGLLIFDYVRTQGHGLDTMHGVRQRDAVLDFVENRFEIVSGSIQRERDTGLTLAAKRR